MPGYVGRFAPSPSGPLHAGSLVAALASFLDARAHGGRWLVRIEDVDTPRTVAGADQFILHQLGALGMVPDAPPVWQSQRYAHYRQAFERLQKAGQIYGCRCTRRELPAGPYPGTCRPAQGMPVSAGRPASSTRRPIRSWRFCVEAGVEHFCDRWLGPQHQDVMREIGDFIIRRGDGLWAYQLAVVVDDGQQGVTHIVRGVDLLDSTARQRQLARALGLPSPQVLHVPLRCDALGRKLSKQNHAPALNLADPLQALQEAWHALGFEDNATASLESFWARAIPAWARRFGPDGIIQSPKP